MSIGYLISLILLMIGIFVLLGVYTCTMIFENAELKRRERLLNESFKRAIKENKLYNLD